MSAQGRVYKHEPAPVREWYEQVTGGKGPGERAAEKVERALGRALAKAQRQRLAQG